MVSAIILSFPKFFNLTVSGLSRYGAEKTQKLRAFVVVNADRANEVVGEESLSAFRTVTGHGTTYFNKVSRDVPRVYL